MYMRTTNTHAKTILALCDLGFLHPRIFNEDHWAAVIQFGSFGLLVDGDRDALQVGYKNRWLYRNVGGAMDALDHWDGSGQPEGFMTAHLSADMTLWP